MGRFFYLENLAKIIAKVLFFIVFVIALRLGTDSTILPMEGVASWYYEHSPGINYVTSSKEVFDDDEMTCATWDFPFDTMLEVTNVRNGQKVLVRVNDRGPAKRLYRKGRIIDLTKAAFKQIEDPKRGLARVKIRVTK
ncbi:MAG: septal ring lytic transglycosylase RlpA family protein [Candidatus Omnitrophota bacterium]